MPQRILYLTPYYLPESGAAATRISATCAFLRDHGFDVSVLTAYPNYPGGIIYPGYEGYDRPTEVIDGIPVHRVRHRFYPNPSNTQRIRSYLSFLTAALPKLLRLPVDKLIVESPPLTNGIAALLFRLLRGKPYIFFVADLWPDLIESLGFNNPVALWGLRRLERLSYRGADAVVCNTRPTRPLIAGRTRPEKVHCILNGVIPEDWVYPGPDNAFRREWFGTAPFVALFAGSIGHAQGIETLVATAQRLKEVAPEVRIGIVGSGQAVGQLDELVAAKGLAQIVRIPQQPFARMAEVYAAADALLIMMRDIPELSLSTPMKFFEYCAAGRPVIHSGPGDGGVMLTEWDAGVQVPGENPEALASAILALYRDPDARRRMGENALRAAREKLDRRILFRQWLEVLG